MTDILLSGDHSNTEKYTKYARERGRGPRDDTSISLEKASFFLAYSLGLNVGSPIATNHNLTGIQECQNRFHNAGVT